MLLFAYAQGGAAATGLVSLALLVPTALFAPFAGPLIDRFGASRVLLGAYLMQGGTMAGTAVSLLAGAPPGLGDCPTRHRDRRGSWRVVRHRRDRAGDRRASLAAPPEGRCRGRRARGHDRLAQVAARFSRAPCSGARMGSAKGAHVLRCSWRVDRSPGGARRSLLRDRRRNGRSRQRTAAEWPLTAAARVWARSHCFTASLEPLRSSPSLLRL